MTYSPSIQFVEKQVLAETTSPVTQPTATGCLLKCNNGYANTPIHVTTESELVKYFGKPNDYNYKMWFDAAGYLKFANNLYVVRPLATSTTNAYLKITPSAVTNDNDATNLYNSDIASITLEDSSYAHKPDQYNIHFFNRYVSTLNDVAVMMCTNETEYEESISKADIFDNTLAVKTIYDRSTLPAVTSFKNKDRIIVRESVIADDLIAGHVYYVYYLDKLTSSTGTWTKTTDTIEDGDRLYITSESLAYDFAYEFTSAPAFDFEVYSAVFYAAAATLPTIDMREGDRLIQRVNGTPDTFRIWEYTDVDGTLTWVATADYVENSDVVFSHSDNLCYDVAFVDNGGSGADELTFTETDPTMVYVDSFAQYATITTADNILFQRNTNGMIINSVVQYLEISLYTKPTYNPVTFSSVLNRKPDFVNDEIGIVVLKKNNDGYFYIVETFIHSLDSDAKQVNGKSNFIDTNINSYSKYIYCLSNDCTANGTNAISNNDGSILLNTITDNTLYVDYSDITDYDTLYTSADSVFGKNGFIQPEILIGFDNGDTGLYSGYLNAMSIIAGETEMSLAIIAPSRCSVGVAENVINDEVVNDLGNRRSDTSFGGLTEFNSYTFVVGQMKKFYDKYNDKYRWVGVSGDIAGMMTRNDGLFGFQSPLAGYNRGKFINHAKMLFSGTYNQDILSFNGINAIIYDNVEDGYYLFDYLTNTQLDEIVQEASIRRMVLRIKHLLKVELRNAFFEFNNETTRTKVLYRISGIFEYFVKNGGLSDYKLICDETNNTAEKINNNEFVLDIRLQPNRFIKYITVNISIYDMGLNISELN